MTFHWCITITTTPWHHRPCRPPALTSLAGDWDASLSWDTSLSRDTGLSRDTSLSRNTSLSRDTGLSRDNCALAAGRQHHAVDALEVVPQVVGAVEDPAAHEADRLAAVPRPVVRESRLRAERLPAVLAHVTRATCRTEQHGWSAGKERGGRHRLGRVRPQRQRCVGVVTPPSELWISKNSSWILVSVCFLSRHRLGCFCTHHSLGWGGGSDPTPPCYLEKGLT